MVKHAVLSNKIEKLMNSKLKDGHSVSLGLLHFPLTTISPAHSNLRPYFVKVLVCAEKPHFAL